MLFGKRLMLYAVVVVMVVLGVSGLGLANPGEGVTITSGKASWSSNEPPTAVFVLLLEELGYTVEDPILFASNPIAYLSIAQGDIDYWSGGSFPEHNGQLPFNFERDGSIVGNFCPSCGIEGYLADIPSIEKYDIKTLDDFKRPEVKEAFDTNGDGKADLYGCPPGWGCHEVIEHHLDAYDLRSHINHIQADYSMNFADVVARVRTGEPVLFYTWGPNDSILLVVPGEDVQWIGVPFADIPYEEGMDEEAVSEEALIAHGLDGAVSDPIIMGFGNDSLQIVANNRFLEANPAAERLFEVVQFPLEWISQATARVNEGEDTPEEILQIAQEWIDNNRSLADEWLDEARAAAL